MAKKKKKEERNLSEQKVTKHADAITWDDIAAMSDSDDDGFDNTLELNKKVKNLQQAISKNIGNMLDLLHKTDGEKEEFEEDVLVGSSSEEEQETNDREDVESREEIDRDLYGGKKYEKEADKDNEEGRKCDSDGKENGESFIDQIKNKSITGNNCNSNCSQNENDHKGNEDNDEENAEIYSKLENNNVNSKALSIVATDLNSVHSKMPWAETFVIVPPTPLPFGENTDPKSNTLDIHDDLKREVAFYNTTLKAVILARTKLRTGGIPFARPDDFFAEMVKTDEQMASVKDRLIFENKKIEAVAQRKSNKEQKLRAKESHADRLAEKAKRKRDHFQEVEEWANSAAKNRGGVLREDVDDYFLNNRYNGTGPSRKRQNADKRFGYGGKKGRFKQNDRKSINNVSAFNPRGNFAGGMKKSYKKDGSGAGASRAGKRARDAKRARR